MLGVKVMLLEITQCCISQLPTVSNKEGHACGREKFDQH
jgi:hypothetical protein